MPRPFCIPHCRFLFCLVFVFTIVGTATSVAQKAADPLDVTGALGLGTPRVRVRSLDAIIVESANRSLLEYAKLSAPKQKLLALFAMEVAKVRRAALTNLIRRDPQEALRLSLSPGQRQGLPKFVVDLLETRIHAVGDLSEGLTEQVPLGNPLPPLQTSWTARTDKTTREAFVYGVRLGHQTKYDTPLHGIAIDDVMAVDESPLYLYDEFEKLQLGFQPDQIVVTSGGLPILLPNPEAVAGLRKALLDRILRFGPYELINLIPPGAPHPWTTGAKRVLVIVADYSDRPGALYTDAQIAAVFGETSDFYQENSQGLTSLTPTVLPATLPLPLTSAAYAAMGIDRGHATIDEDAAAAARVYDATMGGTGMHNPDSYDRWVVLTPQVFSIATAWGRLSGKGVVITGDKLVFPTLAHEMGHTYGFRHSNFWLVRFGENPIGPGDRLEYGDAWDMMGNPYLDRTDEEPRRRHFNTFFKWLAGWLPVPSFADGWPGGTFRLYRHDAADSAGLRAIRIDADADKLYWLDIRRQFPWNSDMSRGIEVRRVLKDPTSTYPYLELQLLDMEPMVDGSIDHSLTPFGSLFGVFEDAANSIRVIVIRVSSDEIGEYADVRIELGGA